MKIKKRQIIFSLILLLIMVFPCANAFAASPAASAPVNIVPSFIPATLYETFSLNFVVNINNVGSTGFHYVITGGNIPVDTPIDQYYELSAKAKTYSTTIAAISNAQAGQTYTIKVTPILETKSSIKELTRFTTTYKFTTYNCRFDVYQLYSGGLAYAEIEFFTDSNYTRKLGYTVTTTQYGQVSRYLPEGQIWIKVNKAGYIEYRSVITVGNPSPNLETVYTIPLNPIP